VPRQRTNVLDEPISPELWEGGLVDKSALGIHLTCHHALATKLVQRVMEATDPGKKIDESKLHVSPRHAAEHTAGQGRN
jgi:hypothetical protein